MHSTWILLLVGAICAIVENASASNAEGEAFLKANAEKEGVVVTKTGLQYLVLKSGEDGGKTPQVNSKCKCHYRGTLISGVEFDSSYKRGTPSTFAPNQVWLEEGLFGLLHIHAKCPEGCAFKISRGVHATYPEGCAFIISRGVCILVMQRGVQSRYEGSAFI